MSESSLSGGVGDEPRVVRRARGSAPRDATPDPLRGRLGVLLLWASIVVATAIVLLAGLSPTGSPLGDIVWSLVLVAVVAAASRSAAPWTIIWSSGVALVAAVPSVWALAGLIGLFGAAAAVARPSWRPWSTPAALAALVALVHLPPLRFHGGSALVVAVALVPLLLSGFRSAGRRSRRLASVALVVAAVLVLGAGIVAAVTVLSAAPDLDTAASTARSGLDLARDGRTAEAVVEFDRASADFDAAASSLDGPLVSATSVVPVLAQHVAALRVAAESGGALSRAASEVSARAESSPDLVVDGRVDLDWIRASTTPASASADTLEAARVDLAAVRSPWLLAPLAAPLDDLVAELDDTAPSARTAADLLGVAPDLLGSSAPKRYLVLATNLAEARYLGGFVGGYVELEAVDGRLEVIASGKASDLTPLLEAQGAGPVGDAAYRDRYGSFAPERYLTNATAAPDAARSGSVAAEVYGRLTGRPIDGVVVIDAAGLAALLRVTGPVEVDGVPEPITADNVEAFLHRDQYLEFDQRSGERTEVLGDVAEAVVDALTGRGLPGPRALADAVAPAVERGDLQFWFRDPAAQEIVERTPVAGRFLPVPGQDLLSVRSSNLNANKIDGFASRVVGYRVSYDPGSGRVSSVVEVAVTNAAPASGLPNILIGIDSRPPGTNRMLLTVWSPQSLVAATVDGVASSTSTQPDGALQSHTVRLAVPPGATQVVRFELEGRIDTGPTYRLVTYQQPAVTPDVVDVAVSSTDGSKPEPSVGFTVVDGVASGRLPSTWRTETSVTFVPGT